MERVRCVVLGTEYSQKAHRIGLAISVWKEQQCRHLGNRKALGVHRNKAKSGELEEEMDVIQPYWHKGCKSLLRSGR